MSEKSSREFIERIKADIDFAQAAAEFLNDFSANDDELHHYLACFASEQGYEFDIEAITNSLDRVKLKDILLTTTFAATRGLDFALPKDDNNPPMVERKRRC